MKKHFIKTVILCIVMSLLLVGCAGKNNVDLQSESDNNSNIEEPSNGNLDTSGNSSGANNVFKIGISQFVEHPALDSAREGFMEGLKEEGFEIGKNIDVLLENAQADFPTTQTIANKLIAEKVDLILAIATPSAQSAANATKDIPILVTAVTDLVDAGLVESMDKPGTNVTGTSDLNPVQKQLELLKEILPDSKSVGVIYNAAEPNSVIQVDIAKEVAKDLGLKIFEATVANSGEVNQAIQSLASKVDVIYTPTDNTVASAISAIVKVANDDGIPVVGSERGQVEGGAIATIGIDYFSLGKQTGHMAVKILKGENPASTPAETSNDLKLVINQTSADTLNLRIPEQVLSRADEILK